MDRSASPIFIKSPPYLALIALLLSSNAYALRNYWDIPETELRTLPPFCKHGYEKYGIPRREAQWLNHLCPGLYALNHAKSIIDQSSEKNYALGIAKNKLSYTLGHSKETFIFRSAVFVKRGEVYELQGNMMAAISDYQAAIQTNPEEVHAYSALADIYMELGQTRQALEVVEQGLKAKPKSKMLLRRHRKLLDSD